MSIKLYHYTVDKEDGLWDCISESFSEGALKDLKGKDIFDWCVKQSFENGAPYMGALSSDKRTYGFYLPRWGRTYDRYFSTGMKLEDDLSGKIKARYVPEQSGKNTSGNEVSSGKFYSVASSSRFAVASFTERKDGKLDYIETIKINGKEESITAPEFEHDTPVEGMGNNSHSPQLDFFFKTANGTYFIEVKNHEVMDSHKSIELRASYKDTDAFKRLGLIGNSCVRKYVDSEGKEHQYISLIHDNDDKKHFLHASDFGCKLKTFHFDFKQFLCHLMGIWSYAQNNPSEEIYFYYLIYRNRLYEETYGGNLYMELEAEVKTIFEVFGKRFPKIHFGLCYHDKYDTLTELNESIVDADGAKDKQEKWDAGFLFDHLGITAYHKCESPDFTFDYEGKLIGLELTRCYPIGITIENNSWQKYHQQILRVLNESKYPPRFISYSVTTHNEGKMNYKKVAEEIIRGYEWMLDKGVNRLDASACYGFKFERLSYLSYCPDYAPEHFMLSEMLDGVESKVDMNAIIESVSKKENKLDDYKLLPENNTIQEYWLAVYIPTDEHCVIESDATLFKDSQFNRIYLINGRYVGDLMRGDTSNIKRLK